MAKRVRNAVGLGGLSALGAQKSQTELKRSHFQLFSSILTLVRLCFGLFGPRGLETPGTDFRLIFSGLSKPVVWGTRGLHPGFPWFSSFPWFP